MRIFAGKLPEDFSVGNDLCFSLGGALDSNHPIEYFLSKKSVFVGEIDRASIKKVERSFECIIDEIMLPRIASLLNAKHGVDFSVTFWNDCLGLFVGHVLHDSWITFQTLLQLVEKVKGQKVTFVLFPTIYRPCTVYEWVEYSMSSGYEAWVLANTMKMMSKQNWKIDIEESRIESFNKKGDINLRKKLSRIKKDCMTILHGVLISCVGNFEKKRYDRMKIEVDIPKEWIEASWKIIKSCIPKFYYEEFNKNLTNVKRFHLPRLFNGEVYDDKLNLSIAVSRNRVKLFHQQHGGGFGYLEVMPFLQRTEFSLYGFISWGWKKYSGYYGNIIPLPSMFLNSLPEHKKKTDKIIFVNGAFNPALKRLHSQPVSDEEYLDWRNNTHNFLKKCNHKVINNLIFRPFEGNEKFIYNESIEALQKVYSRKAFKHLLVSCALVAIDHPTTTLCNAIAKNIPVVGFWNPEYWSLTEEAKPYFNALREVGIVHDDGGSAAKHVNEVYEDIEGWWNQPEVQEARKDWAMQFALTNKNWLWAWIKIIWKRSSITSCDC